MTRKAQPKKRVPNSDGRAQSKPWEPTAIQLQWWKLWTEGSLGPSEIARLHGKGVVRSTVWKALQKVSEWMRMQFVDDNLAFRNRQVQQYDMVQREMIQAYYRSIGPVEQKTTSKTEGGDVDDDDAGKVHITTKVDVSQGDTSYIAQYISAGKAISDLLGNKAPEKSEVKVQHSEEIPELPAMHSFNSHAEALEAISKLFAERAAVAAEAGL